MFWRLRRCRAAAFAAGFCQPGGRFLELSGEERGGARLWLHPRRLACARAEPADLREGRALHHALVAAWLRGDRLGDVHRNRAIHRRIVELAGNRALAECHRTINARVYRARDICNLRTRRFEKAIREHEQILGALERRDGAAVAALLETQVLAVRDSMRAMETEGAHGVSAATAAPEASRALISSSE